MKRAVSRFLSMALIISMAMATTACGAATTKKSDATGKAEQYAPTLDTQTSCDLIFVGSYNNFEALEQQIDQFNEYYPNVSIVYTYVDDYNNTLQTVLSSNEAPDLFMTKSWMSSKSTMQGIFDYAEDLSDPSIGLNLDCIREDLIIRRDDGTVPMLPVFSNTYGILVNEDIFEKNNLEIPTTPTQLESACAKLRELGYQSPLVGFNSDKGFFEPLALGILYAHEVDHPGFVKELNEAGDQLGEVARPVIEDTVSFVEKSGIDLDYCDAEITDNYNELILRFFEGDIPMALGVADTVSGTIKRESKSDAFTANPFKYSFRPLPISDEGVYMFSHDALDFSVNKNSANMDMANEFMRFLINNESLNEMAENKHLLTVTYDMSLDGLYTGFDSIPQEHIIGINTYKLSDDITNQVRKGAYEVANGHMTVDEAVSSNLVFD